MGVARRLVTIAMSAALAAGAVAISTEASAGDGATDEPVFTMSEGEGDGVFADLEPGALEEIAPIGNRILNGVDATSGQYPWTVWLVFDDGAGGLWTCGGSVIHPRWVLTAAHCTYGAASSMVFADGIDRPTDLGDPRWIPSKLNWYATAYDPNAFGVNDVGIVEMNSPLSNPTIPIADTSDPSIDAPGVLSVVAGWGVLRPGGPSPVRLQRTYEPLRTAAECQAMYPAPPAQYDHTTNICAGYAVGEAPKPSGSCVGDSGSALMSHDAHGLTQVGIVSYGNGQCTSLQFHGVYMRADAFKAGLETFLNSFGESLPSAPPAKKCQGKNATHAGTPGPDVIVGTNAADVVAALGQNDEVRGLNGHDLLCGSAGNDLIYGDNGNDTILGEAGNDNAYGNGGNDTITGHAGNDRLRGNSGGDTLRGSVGNDTLDGHTGDDTMFGEAGKDLLRGYAGKDRHNGGPGVDKCIGGTGVDTASQCETKISIP